ncbi:PliI family lysozyme inhibitor of I-type lysozyme [Flavobacterium sp. K5-23]|uniref:PliI family lysozyme inhibitor of I-type lysozyme n=1 Tax=Flavobacterium sp. K5-23 TaxID=2746225 RepID=UPI00200D7B9B|nr:PliI family lysozyme inhibitor of I-type lysozyme [Flavobacterium sp. K5-23]UQD56761.1 hypothetical protein FLAK523_10315 [Flavobacterium sp. K5-23]
MLILKKISVFFILILTFSACKKNSDSTTEKERVQPTNTNNIVEDFTGNYVSTEYSKRKQGYDWIAVLVTPISDNGLHISVRSRADKKKPSCTFDSDAQKINETTYQSEIDGKNIFFTFYKNRINISTEKEEDHFILNYFCSGGGTLLGNYNKIDESFDKAQMDPRVFNKSLSLQNIHFDISTTGEGSIQQLIIQPYGLTIDNSKISMTIDGSVTNAEIEDLNSDGFPEILIYTTSAGSGSYGNVIGYSVNNGKSISQIYFPPISENPKANKGYMGHDSFGIVETTLVQRFQTYKEGDPNVSPTGVIRQIQYKLKDGQDSRKFVVDKIVEFPNK